MTVFPYPELNTEKEAQYELFPINLTRMMLHTKGQTVPYLKYSLSFRDAAIEPSGAATPSPEANGYALSPCISNALRRKIQGDAATRHDRR
jgi:hypothetical protein